MLHNTSRFFRYEKKKMSDMRKIQFLAQSIKNSIKITINLYSLVKTLIILVESALRAARTAEFIAVNIFTVQLM